MAKCRHGLLFPEVCRSHTTTRHSRYDSSGPLIGPTQRPLPDNTQHSQATTHAPAGIEPIISAGRRPQTYVSDRAATATVPSLLFSSLYVHLNTVLTSMYIFHLVFQIKCYAYKSSSVLVLYVQSTKFRISSLRYFLHFPLHSSVLRLHVSLTFPCSEPSSVCVRPCKRLAENTHSNAGCACHCPRTLLLDYSVLKIRWTSGLVYMKCSDSL